MGVSFTFILLKTENDATTTAHIHKSFARMFEKKKIIGRTMWDQTGGCAKQYMCFIDYYMMSFL